LSRFKGNGGDDQNFSAGAGDNDNPTKAFGPTSLDRTHAFTVDLRVRFRGRVSPGEELRVHGWVVEKRKRRVLTEAILVTGTGIERAHAWAAFLVPRG
jgi:acyl-coenzyme A thioesterase PaaI-like protein